jgi:recombination protein RecA
MSNSLNSLYSDLRKKYGEDSVMWATEMPKRPPITSGSLALDFAVGIGGLPQDRVMEIAGRDSCGKTTLALMIMTHFLDAHPDRGALFLDLEHKTTESWVEFLIGPERMKRVMYIQADHAEQATNIYKAALPSGQVCFALFDSIGGAPTSRRNEDAEVASVGGNALAIAEFSRQAANLSAKYNCLTIGINQVRSVIGGMYPGMMDTPGGNAWRHACVLRLQLTKSTREVDYLTRGSEKLPVGHMIHAKVVKNQLGGIEGRTTSWWFYSVETPEHPFGIDTLDEIVRLGIITEVIVRTGGWYNHPALPGGKAQGLEGLKKLVRDDESLRAILTSEILASLADHGDEVAPLSEPEQALEAEA